MRERDAPIGTAQTLIWWIRSGEIKVDDYLGKASNLPNLSDPRPDDLDLRLPLGPRLLRIGAPHPTDAA